MDIDILRLQLTRDEDKRARPYVDTKGKITIGIGRNLTDRGLSEAEIQFLFENDVKSSCDDLNQYLPWWKTLSDVRQRVLVNMCFNLGITRLLEFRKMLKALELGNYQLAATEMADSDWAQQVGNRAIRLEEMMRQG